MGTYYTLAIEEHETDWQGWSFLALVWLPKVYEAASAMSQRHQAILDEHRARAVFIPSRGARAVFSARDAPIDVLTRRRIGGDSDPHAIVPLQDAIEALTLETDERTDVVAALAMLRALDQFGRAHETKFRAVLFAD